MQKTSNSRRFSINRYAASTKKNIVICGTINDAFAVRLIKTLSASNNYNSIAVGMPTWDGIKDLDKPDCKGVDLIYSTPYNFVKTDKAYISFTAAYKNKLSGRPSDMAFKGFESMYHFTKLLLQHDHNLINILSEKNNKVFNDFDIRAAKNRTTKNTDYLENRNLYFIKKTDGVIKSVNWWSKPAFILSLNISVTLYKIAQNGTRPF